MNDVKSQELQETCFNFDHVICIRGLSSYILSKFYSAKIGDYQGPESKNFEEFVEPRVMLAYISLSYYIGFDYLSLICTHTY